VSKWQAKVYDVVRHEELYPGSKPGGKKLFKTVTAFNSTRGAVENCGSGNFTAAYFSNMAVYAHSLTTVAFGVELKQKLGMKYEYRIIPASEEADYINEHSFFTTLVILNGELLYAGNTVIAPNAAQGLCIHQKPQNIFVFDSTKGNLNTDCYVEIGRIYTEECKAKHKYSSLSIETEFMKQVTPLLQAASGE